MRSLICAVAVLAVCSMASADLCDKCKDMFFIQNIGTCSECGGHTTSGAHKYCPACSKKLGKCEHCGAALGGVSGPTSKPATAPATAPASKQVTMSGVAKDESLLKAAPADKMIVTQEALDKLAAAWGFKAPAVDWSKQFVIVATVFGPNRAFMDVKLEDDGNLKLVVGSTKMAGPGFGWVLMVHDRAGVKSVDGKPLAK